MFQIIVTMHQGGQERGTTMSVYSHLKHMVEVLSWFGAQSVVFEVLEVKIDGIKNTVRF